MAITRRQFVTRLGALAAAAGFSQADVSRIVEAMAFTPNLGGTFGKPRVVWIHGAECTGCSTSLLGLVENAGGKALYGVPGLGDVTTGTAVTLSGALPSGDPDDLTLHGAGYGVDGDAINIADVVVDVIDLLYHETVMGMGGDTAYQWLTDFQANNTLPFVLVVEGALQDKMYGGAWGDTSDTSVSWCSIAASDGGTEKDMPSTVAALAQKAQCLAVIPIGQCACYGGYPGCKPPVADPEFDSTLSQTDALGVYDYLSSHGGGENKVVNVPGCPTNPWWFVLTVVCFLVDYVNGPGAATPADGPLGILAASGAIKASSVDSINSRRLKYVYGYGIHGTKCPRYESYSAGNFAQAPGEPGCLRDIGCKGMAASSLCGVHGWNNQQPENSSISTVAGLNTNSGGTMQGGHCTRAGHPCMACTEKGYPDSFVPFVSKLPTA